MREEASTGVAGGAGPTVIDYDLACHGCGYNLRTMALDGRCPECNEAVAESLKALDLARSPEWLGRIRAGLALEPVAGAMVVLSVLYRTVSSLLVRAVLGGGMSQLGLLTAQLVGFGLMVAAPRCLLWWAEWLQTSPREVGECKTSMYRRVLRGLIMVQIVIWIGGRILAGIGLYEAAVFVDWLEILSNLLWSWCFWRWVGVMVAPLRRPGLMKHIRLLQWAVPIEFVLRFVTNAGIDWYRRSTGMFYSSSTALMLLVMVFGLATISVGIWELVIMLVTRYRLAQVETTPAKYWGDLRLASALLTGRMRKVGGWIKYTATYHGPESHE
jgi:hypothetical protein